MKVRIEKLFVLLLIILLMPVMVFAGEPGELPEDNLGDDDWHTHTPASSWSSNDTYHWHACTDPTCTELLDKAAHIWNQGVISTQPTATTAGVKTYTCTVCNTTKTESIPATGGESTDPVDPSECTEHTWDGGVVTKEATTLSYGEMTYTCTVCGATKTEKILKINPLKLSTSKKTYKAKALKKSKKSFTVKVTKFKGKMSYICDDAAKAAKIKLKKTSSTSSTVKYKITVPKKCKKGTYKITIKAAGNNSYQAGSKTIKIVVK